MVLYHGTSDVAWKDIQREGLIPKKGKGGDTWIAEHNPSWKFVTDDTTQAGRSQSVYLTSNRQTAVDFAHLAARMAGGQPVVLLATVAKSKLHPDVQDRYGLRYEETIPPSRIRPDKVPITAARAQFVEYLYQSSLEEDTPDDALLKIPTTTDW